MLFVGWQAAGEPEGAQRMVQREAQSILGAGGRVELLAGLAQMDEHLCGDQIFRTGGWQTPQSRDSLDECWRSIGHRHAQTVSLASVERRLNGRNDRAVSIQHSLYQGPEVVGRRCVCANVSRLDKVEKGSLAQVPAA